MKQMVAPEAPVKEECCFGGLQQGFFRLTLGDRKIFFGSDKSDFRGPTYHFPVLEDGSVSRCGGKQFIGSREGICLIASECLGIKELKFTNEWPDEWGWPSM